MKYVYVILCFLLVGGSCGVQKNIQIHESETLRIEQLSEHTFLYTTYLQTEQFGKVGCNGLIVFDANKALIIDSPTNDSDSKELLDWVENTLNCEPIGLVVTHFHIDCLGGLNEFHIRGIPSYSNAKTIELTVADGKVSPQNGFVHELEIRVGKKKVFCEYIGEGHTNDNIVCYFPNEKVLFGGCLIKAIGAGKGNLDDANIEEWSNTVKKVKVKYDGVKIVVPGHGEYGGANLLDYTIEMFEK